MSDRLLLDTHIVLWLDSGDPHLSPPTRALIDACWRAGGTICVSAVMAWEIALLVDTGRIELDVPTEIWLRRFLGRPGLKAILLSHTAACQAYQFAGLDHRDPAPPRSNLAIRW